MPDGTREDAMLKPRQPAPPLEVTTVDRKA
jgi:hypothetical protein